MKEQDIQLMDAYLSEELSENERVDFEHRLNTDAEFRQEFELYREGYSYLKARFEKESERQAVEKNIRQIGDRYFQSAPESKSSRIQLWKWGIAASVAVLIGLFFFVNTQPPVFSDYNDYAPINLTVRGQQPQLPIEASDAFNQRNYKKAVTLLERLYTETGSAEYELYLAISLTEINDFERADFHFKNLVSKASPYQNQALWHAALSQLKQENLQRCKALLEQISPTSEEYARAQKLIKKL